MRRGNLGDVRRTRARGRTGGRALEDLVQAVAALDGPQAERLLSGLSSSLRPAAVAKLRRLDEGSRPERHARLATAFARPTPCCAEEQIPGRLGSEIRKRFTRGPSSGGGTGAAPMERWAIRLVLELGDR